MRLDLHGLEFNVEVEGEGKPLLLLHGFTGSARAWDAIRPHLASVARVIVPDLIGHGDSAKPAHPARYSLEWCARDLLALLDALDVRRAIVLGYSMGGRVALHLAVSAPERIEALILESASPGIEDAAERTRRVASDEALAQRILVDGIAAFVDEWEQQPLLALQPHVGDGVRQRQHELRLLNDPVGLANSLRGMGTGQMQPLWARLAALEFAVHLIAGAEDSRYSAVARSMATLLPRAESTVVAGAGHTVHLDQPEAFTRLVRAVLTNRVTPADCTMSRN